MKSAVGLLWLMDITPTRLVVIEMDIPMIFRWFKDGYIRQGGYVFISVCLLAGLRKTTLLIIHLAAFALAPLSDCEHNVRV